MVEPILLVVAIVIIGGLIYDRKKQYQKGAHDLFQLFVQSGYTQKVAMFKSLNAHHRPGGTVFVGDSITQDFPIHEYFKGQNVYNRGIGGDTSAGVLKRLDESIFQLNPQHVFLLIGTNDLVDPAFKPAETFENIKKIIEAIHAFDERLNVHLISILPVNETLDQATVSVRHNTVIQSLNEQLKTIKNIDYIDAYSALSDENQRLRKNYTLEGLHLNQEGYHVLSRLINESWN